MKFFSSAIFVALLQVQGAATAEDLECKSEGVTNKATCDTWCGSVGGFTSSYLNSGVQGMTGWACDCNADSVTNSTSDKKCAATFDFEGDAQDCTSEGVSVKATCDSYCGEVGAYNEYIKDDDLYKIDCTCGTAVNEYEKHCISDYSSASGMSLAAASVMAGLGLVHAIASMI